MQLATFAVNDIKFKVALIAQCYASQNFIACLPGDTSYVVYACHMVIWKKIYIYIETWTYIHTYIFWWTLQYIFLIACIHGNCFLSPPVSKWNIFQIESFWSIRSGPPLVVAQSCWQHALNLHRTRTPLHARMFGIDSKCYIAYIQYNLMVNTTQYVGLMLWMSYAIFLFYDVELRVSCLPK